MRPVGAEQGSVDVHGDVVRLATVEQDRVERQAEWDGAVWACSADPLRDRYQQFTSVEVAADELKAALRALTGEMEPISTGRRCGPRGPSGR
ncbi:hypothetical protein Ahu01nite_073360 [Winogradskya humida]|uniref:Uncharacterized protein n=1 Tax=Winogradskya humida TaxID=113566 RepID=A0ABQ4A0I9_9ACTN|nr:hypothetical protein Ahu01nite_073360 [Actinoplanes humidus]